MEKESLTFFKPILLACQNNISFDKREKLFINYAIVPFASVDIILVIGKKIARTVM